MLQLPPERSGKFSPAGHNPTECLRTCDWHGDPSDTEAWLAHYLSSVAAK
jgi:hypothetical protein